MLLSKLRELAIAQLSHLHLRHSRSDRESNQREERLPIRKPRRKAELGSPRLLAPHTTLWPVSTTIAIPTLMTEELKLLDAAEYVEVSIENAQYLDAEGYALIQKDYRVGGEVWRVHKGDADPYPSQPHAHCVGGRKAFIGRTLHLGTRELYDGRKPLGLFLDIKQFERLIVLIRPKFPNIELPLPT